MVKVGCWFSQRPRRDPDLPLALGEPALRLTYHKNPVFLLGFWLISQAHFCFIGNNIDHTIYEHPELDDDRTLPNTLDAHVGTCFYIHCVH